MKNLLPIKCAAILLLIIITTPLNVTRAVESGMAFRAQDANVSIAHNTRLEPSYTGKFTVSLWYKPEAITSNPLPRLWGKGANYIAVMGNPANSEHHRVGMELSQNDSIAEFWARTTRLEDGKWYHIVISFDQKDCAPTMQINGVVQTVKVKYAWCGSGNKKIKSNTKPVMIGNRTTFERPAAGFIRDVAYYDRVLTPEEQIGLYTGTYPTENLVYRLPMCDSACTTVPDISGNGYNGTAYNTAWDAPQ
jgi:hypothetical protein